MSQDSQVQQGFQAETTHATRVVGGVDFIRATGLIARGYSKLTLQPTDITGGIKDVIDGVTAFGFNIPNDVKGVFDPADQETH